MAMIRIVHVDRQVVWKGDKAYPKVVVTDSRGLRHSALDHHGRLARLADRLCREGAAVALDVEATRFGSHLRGLSRVPESHQEGSA